MNQPGRLWAPWRSPYISQVRRDRARCIFCRAKRTRDDRRAQIVFRGQRTFVLINRYPYNPGHLMVAPNRHIGSIGRLATEERAELLQVAGRMVAMLGKTMAPHGYNLGINMGRVAGAGIPGHLHLHIVPRWSGDTNFMPVIGHTKVMSQSLEALFDLITQAVSP